MEIIRNPIETDYLTPIVARVMQIDDFTLGDPKKNFIVRYRGRIYNEDTTAAYDQLAESLRSLKMTPLFRWDGKQHAIILATDQARRFVFINSRRYLEGTATPEGVRIERITRDGVVLQWRGIQFLLPRQ